MSGSVDAMSASASTSAPRADDLVLPAALSPVLHSGTVRLCDTIAVRSHDVDRAGSPACTGAGDSTRLPTKGVSMASLSSAEPTRFLTVEHFSATTGIPIPTVQRQLRAKLIPGAKLGRRWLIPTAAITALEERALQGGDQ
jgi:excisionase family DNA binding protein